ncbi:hypothetical protein [Taibaiella koreensis]|uniref:hypothetical protein n=1 Tax=Taibaiella koreensis TaxID=1268548 RepID=UPI0013C2F9E7|nr:hypothetical protein [Taibaiella koreensis]
MKRFTIISTVLCCMGLSAAAQEKKDIPEQNVDRMLHLGKEDSAKDKTYISLGTEGIRVSSKKLDSLNRGRKVKLHFLMLDLGINALNDRTDYGSPAAQQYLQVPGDKKNSSLFSLRQGKSINVNIWPVLMDIRLLKTRNQKISLYTGAGLQLYNFKFNKDISYLNNTSPMLIEDSIQFSKNKLAFAYVSIPLMVNFKTRMGGNFWVTYGLGVIGGYCFDSWTKQISDERGKQKNHDQFNFQKFNLNLSGEIGINGYIRFYGTYQVTNMYQNSLVQNPYCIGIRFFGI